MGLALTLLHSPKLLILDEPTNGLDPAGIKHLRDILKEVAKKENAAVFVSSHILTEMQLMCDRVAVINKGKIVKVEDISEDKNSEEKIETIISVKQIEKADEILKKEGYEIKSWEGRNVHLKLEEDKISEVIKLLVKNDVDIDEVIKNKKNLEDIFFSATEKGGNNNEND